MTLALSRMSLPRLILAIIFAGTTAPAMAQTRLFRMATSADAGSLDPMASNAFFNYLPLLQVYEALVHRGDDMRVGPGLAHRWERLESMRWRFHLRDGVRFAGGETFSADDVAFSLRRAAAPTSNINVYLDTLDRVNVVDQLTVDLVTRVPDAVLPNKLFSVAIMSRTWAEANGVARAPNATQREETHATRNANGTGPFVIRSWQPDQRMIMRRNPVWWGAEVHAMQRGNVGEYHHVILANDATRVAALLSGEVDMAHLVPNQDVERLRRDPRLLLLEGPENRVVFLGLDQEREELPGSDVRGRNPFRDLRVRQAIAHAIDVETIRRVTLRGLAIPRGSMWTPFVNGYDEANDRRLPFDRDRARTLLAEAGLPNGFSVTLDCPSGVYADVCQALPAMLAPIGIRVTLNLMPQAQFSPRVLRRESAFYGLSSMNATYDGLYTLRVFMVSPAMGGAASWNAGGYRNARLDDLVRQTEAEADPDRRRSLMREAHAIHNAELGHIVLYQRVIPWALRRGVAIAHRADNIPIIRQARVE